MKVCQRALHQRHLRRHVGRQRGPSAAALSTLPPAIASESFPASYRCLCLGLLGSRAVAECSAQAAKTLPLDLPFDLTCAQRQPLSTTQTMWVQEVRWFGACVSAPLVAFLSHKRKHTARTSRRSPGRAAGAESGVGVGIGPEPAQSPDREAPAPQAPWSPPGAGLWAELSCLCMH